MLKYITSSKRKNVDQDENKFPVQKKSKVDDASEKSVTPTRRKQASSFRNEWVRGRDWLYFIPGEGMYCKLCQKYNMCPYDRDTWNKTPSRRIRLCTVKEHEQTTGHRDATKRELTAAASQNIGEIIQPEVNRDAITSAFTVLYFLAKQRIPHTTNFEPVLDLLSQLGLSVKENLRVSKNATYCSDKSIQEMLAILSSTIEESTIEQLKKSEYFAIMLDETTDVSVSEQLTLNCRFLNESGQLCVRFLKMIEPLKSSDITQPSSTVTLNASTIAGHVAEYIEGKQLNAHQLVGIGTDGAAVMTGKNNGVVKKLQEFATTAIGIHCSAHRLQLASCQAANAAPFVKKFHTILRQLYDYYDNSAVRMAGLHAVQTALGEKVLKPIQPSSTRWLSIEMSTTRLKESYVSILVSLEREGEERGTW
uniref:Zinc finger protein 862-like n=1 Tax=Saccoglossus kowalevskii TaxID=10224 RepID=A0ABM0ME11_SACKO|nr:PREDICTED: zinc finger protein 862-like [Saccoglossus kowalevskii]